MGKKRKDTLQPRRKPVLSYPIPLPTAASRDEMTAMTDDELVTRIDTLYGDMAYVIDNCPLPPKPWEQEIAYAQRELGWRQERRRRHDAWLAQQTTDATPTAA